MATIDEMRSNFVEPSSTDLPSDTPPCTAPDGYAWVHAFSPTEGDVDRWLVGKWLIRLQCRFVNYCWRQVRGATEAGTLGIAAKVSTDWHNKHDAAGEWGATHAICVYTRDWHDRDDVLRVARRLREIDAVRRSVLYYKPDIETYTGLYAGNLAGMIAIYEAKPPYEEMIVRADALKQAEQLLAGVRRRGQAAAVVPGSPRPSSEP